MHLYCYIYVVLTTSTSAQGNTEDTPSIIYTLVITYHDTYLFSLVQGYVYLSQQCKCIMCILTYHHQKLIVTCTMS